MEAGAARVEFEAKAAAAASPAGAASLPQHAEIIGNLVDLKKAGLHHIRISTLQIRLLMRENGVMVSAGSHERTLSLYIITS